MNGIIDFTDGSTWVVPDGYTFLPHERPMACRSCGNTILFFETRRGKRAPFDPDGTSHFATCSDPERWRTRR